MATTDVALVNRALALVGEALLEALLSENEKVNAIYSSERDTLLAMHPWTFALKRTRVTVAGLLDCSSKVITFADADPDTIADDGSEFVTKGFEDGDIVSIEGSGKNNSSYAVKTVAAGTLTLETHEEVTAEVLTNDTDLKLYALVADGRYKYPKPSDCLRVHKVNEINVLNEPTDWTKEGKYIVSDTIDSNDQLPIVYIKKITDPTLFDLMFEECLVVKLCGALSMAFKENVEQAKMWMKHFQYKFREATQRNAWEGNPDRTRKNSSWESAGH